jgi:hypothetical protein
VLLYGSVATHGHSPSISIMCIVNAFCVMQAMGGPIRYRPGAPYTS